MRTSTHCRGSREFVVGRTRRELPTQRLDVSPSPTPQTTDSRIAFYIALWSASAVSRNMVIFRFEHGSLKRVAHFYREPSHSDTTRNFWQLPESTGTNAIQFMACRLRKTHCSVTRLSVDHRVAASRHTDGISVLFSIDEVTGHGKETHG
jgi:hypothetical protein